MSDSEELDRFDPDDADDPHGDRATLRQLEKRGADLSQATHFLHYIVFPDEQSARAGGKLVAEQLGYRVRGSAPDAPDEDWLVVAECEEVPALENVQRMGQALRLAAQRHGGEYDGWEAAVRK